MRISSHLRALASSRLGTVLVLVAIIVGSATIGAAAAATTGVISACVNKDSGTVRVLLPNSGGDKDSERSAKGCTKNETPLSWNIQGIQGPAGPTGATGATGPAGAGGVAEGSPCTMFDGTSGVVHVTVSSSNGLSLTCVPPGSAPNWTLTPATRNFNDVAVGTWSPPQSFTITNTGNLAGLMPALVVSPSLAPSLQMDPNLPPTCASFWFNAGASCNFFFEVRPTVTGPGGGTISLTGYPAATMTVTFNGITPPPPAPASFSLQPNLATFSTAPGGVVTNTFALQNSGGSDSGPYTIQITGADAASFSIVVGPPTSCDGTNVLAGMICQIGVTFAPVGPAGTKNATLVVTATGTSASATLQGN